MSTHRVAKLSEALKKQQLVGFNSKFESSKVRGYVQAIGAQFFLVAVVSDRIWFDGFECFRITDVRNLKPDPYVQFIETALKKRRQRIPKRPRIDLVSIENLLATTNREFPLVTIHRERIDPDICQIGRIVSIDHGNVYLLEIGPGAIWQETPDTYRLRDITRVSFGADYENALHIVGGKE